MYSSRVILSIPYPPMIAERNTKKKPKPTMRVAWAKVFTLFTTRASAAEGFRRVKAQPGRMSLSFRLRCFVAPPSMCCCVSAKPSNCNVNCCILLLTFSDAGIRPARFLFPVWEGFVPSAGIFCSQGGNDFPQMTGKAAAVPCR